MRHDRQVELMRRFFDMRRRKTTTLADKSMRVSAASFTSEEYLAQERRRLFRGYPMVVGLSTDAAAPNDYFCTDLDGMPVVVLRGEDGLLRAFVNACRHRGARVFTEDRGTVNGRTASCGFHCWTYDLNGRLLGQPLAREGFSDCDNELLGLRPLPVAESAGLILVTPTDAKRHSEDLEVDVVAALGGLQEELGEYGLEQYHFAESRSRTLPMNWKLVIDTFLESYHIFTLHKQSIAPYFVTTPQTVDAFGPVTRFIGGRSDILRYEDKPEAEWNMLKHFAVEYIIAPNAILVHQFDHFELWRLTPGRTPHECVATTTAYGKGEMTEKLKKYMGKNLDLLIGITDAEDFPAAAQTHQAMASGGIDEIIFGRNEPGLVWYHQTLEAICGRPGDTR